MTGKIIKGIAGFYYVHTESAGVYECKAKGVFRNQKMKPLVGDNVKLEILDEEKKLATIVELLPQKSRLLRPAVANVDQAIVVFAAKDPEPNRNLLNRFLILMTKQELPVIIVFNKTDLISEEEKKELEDGWRNTGYEIRFLSAKKQDGIQEMQEILKGKTTVMAGPSGVGKSTLVNLFQSNVVMETGAVSEKIKRGKHTTRHSEFIWIDEETYILDTPGFSSLTLEEVAAEELKEYFPEFAKYEDLCRFRGCVHENEPDCRVKEAVTAGEISKCRYEDYLLLYRELKSIKKYK
ncbi:MAG: ribosome small subunit-dependent GTPase A [Lachnospiraceae bacterium]|nr:ribosome small subunit-dependent GTPase A [Lachnospiraceae bacterium]